MKRICLTALLIATAGITLLTAGCSRQPRRIGPAVTLSDLLHAMTNRLAMAQLNVPKTEVITSYDRSGSNDDYNNFIGPGDEDGWMRMVELEGPGYISRFWMTGPKRNHRIRFYFDGEKTPRIDTELGAFCGETAPVTSPLAAYENYCWYSFLPIPYQDKLIIECQKGGYKPGGWPRIFYQVNNNPLPKTALVQSYSGSLSADEKALVEQVRENWKQSGRYIANATDHSAQKDISLAPNTTEVLFEATGPAIINALRITPDFKKLASAIDRKAVLRDVLLKIEWNNSGKASVLVPLGDFFGSVWKQTRYESMFFGMSGDTFASRFPMPFESSATISLVNQGKQNLEISAELVSSPLQNWPDNLGYFHSGWIQTSPQQIGTAHPILRAEGRGRYAGCILAVLTLDRSFWILEGDETIRRDDEQQPGWHGTGLEDYFNGGWYYQNVLTRPLHGLPFKAHFRTVQYRMHFTDPVLFDQSLDMVFERGPDHASHGWMESVCFYYVDSPQQAFSRPGSTPGARIPPQDPLEKVTLMQELWNYERFEDYPGAIEFADYYLEKFPDFPYADMLHLRQDAYREKLQGYDAVEPVYEAALTNPPLKEVAGNLLWFNENENNALIHVFANMRTRVYIDGERLGSCGSPERMTTWQKTLPPGKHVLVLQCVWQQYPDWVQAVVQTHQGDFFTTTQCKTAINPEGDWMKSDFDDSEWMIVGGPGTKGPPEEPYIWVYPDAYINVQSKGVALRPEVDWDDHQGYCIYRLTFEIPEKASK